METVLGSRSMLDNVSPLNLVFVLLTTCIAGGIIFLIRHAVSRRSLSSLEQDSSKNLDQPAAAPVNDNANHSMHAQRRNRSKNRRNRQIPAHSWEIATLKGHTDHIYDLSFSHNGRFVITCSADYFKNLVHPHQIIPNNTPHMNATTSYAPEAILQENNLRIESNQYDYKNYEKNETQGQFMINNASTKCDKKRKSQRDVWIPRFTTPSRAKYIQKQAAGDLHINSYEQQNMFQIKIQFYFILQSLTMRPDQMERRGFPVQLPGFPRYAMINNIYPSAQNAKNIAAEGKDDKDDNSSLTDSTFEHEQENLSEKNKRICVRCQMVFYVDETGKYLKEECCSYHGKLCNRGYNDEKYCMSCGQSPSSPGCKKADVHVWNGFIQPGINGPFADYMQTLSSYGVPSVQLYNCIPNLNVYALDCEMCYTQYGLELTKVTLVNLCGKIVYNKFVKPKNKIIDYNTEFSGITEKDMLNVTTTLEDVQRDLKTLICAETILLGHGLANDFRMLRLFHNKVIDTTELFSHPYLPFPFCPKLQKLTEIHLKRKIQEKTHDSFEDAVAVKDLVLSFVHRYYGSQLIGMENIVFDK